MPSKIVPNEILVQIFCLLDRKSIHSLLYLCRQWHTVATPFYFQKIRIKETDLGFGTHFINGHMTQELTLYKESRANQFSLQKLGEQLLLLLSYLPNLERLVIQLCRHSRHYLSILHQLKDTDTYLQRIQEIVFYSNYPKEHVSHFLACYSFCKTIKRLETDVNDNYLMATTSKHLHYYLPQFTCLTHLVYNCQQGNDATLFDILNCCENIVDFQFTSRHPIPSRASSQVDTTYNKHLKRLTISSLMNISAYIDYIRNVQPLDCLNLIIHQDGYKLFQLIEPFAEEFQKFKHLKIDFDYGQSISIPPSYTNVFYSVLCKLKGDRNVLYDAIFSSFSYNSRNFITALDDELSFVYVINSGNQKFFVDTHGIVKSLKFMKNRSTLLDLFNYAKTFPRLETICIEFGDFYLKANKSTVITNCFRPTQTFFDQIHTYLPDTEVITFKRQNPFSGRALGTTWDLTDFKSLKEFNFHVNHLDLQGHDNTFLKFDYGDSHCYRRVRYHIDIRKNLEFGIVSSPEWNSRTLIITIKVYSPSVDINCITNNFYTVEPVAYLN
ncbi:uncharacterized protein EV154DRAFT_526422 [Mucor mucedo]|uniref:uncharacterized protein n=1 Tax=Mucor mucedo TaxID=29922 RepID=UPI00221FE53F|nr:uncharacterized protein EV154DRAFT_526422 [Mucor mucedo]KAI7875731.1 hypothetical protein EV154DRAFT_526422 [Mucor mucedo]